MYIYVKSWTCDIYGTDFANRNTQILCSITTSLKNLNHGRMMR